MRDFFQRIYIRNDLGKRGEEVASTFVRRLGYRVVARNVANPLGKRLGEIDIVAQDGACTVFIEVKTRSDTESVFGLAISREKLQRLSKIGEWYMQQAGQKNHPYRFDMIGVVLSTGKKPLVTHVRDIFL